MSSPRIGIIGAGFHASTNILPALRLANIDIAALATRDIERSISALSRHGLTGRPYGSASELLEDVNVDGVIIIAQPQDQLDLVREALRNGKHVFVDKPLGLNATEARLISDAADAAGKHVMVGFMKRYAPAVRHLRDVVSSDALGKPQSFHIRFGCDSTGFASNIDDFVRLAAIHHIDIARFLFGDMVSIQSVSTNDGAHVFVKVVVTTTTGMVGTIDLIGASSIPSEQDSISVSGTRGWASLTDTRALTISRTTDGDGDWQQATSSVTTYTPAISTMSGGAQDLHIRGFVAELTAFADLVKRGNPVSSSARDNVATTAFCDAIVNAPELANSTRFMSFGAPGPVRDAINASIMDGSKTSSSDLLDVYEARKDNPPVPGEMRLLLDSSNSAIARIRFLEVRSFQLRKLTEATAALEHLSPRDWERVHKEYWTSLIPAIRESPGYEDWEITPEATVITTRFEVQPITSGKDQV